MSRGEGGRVVEGGTFVERGRVVEQTEERCCMGGEWRQSLAESTFRGE